MLCQEDEEKKQRCTMITKSWKSRKKNIIHVKTTCLHEMRDKEYRLNSLNPTKINNYM